jgi:hypothetical protein
MTLGERLKVYEPLKLLVEKSVMLLSRARAPILIACAPSEIVTKLDSSQPRVKV